MVLVDVNLLVYADFADSLRHAEARLWLDGLLGGSEPVARPWAVLTGFIRISTNPRVMTEPLTLEEALGYMDEWLALPGRALVQSAYSDHSQLGNWRAGDRFQPSATQTPHRARRGAGEPA